MVVLTTPCTPENKAAFKALAHENGTTEATLLRRMVQQVLENAGKPGVKEPGAGRGGRGARLTLRLTEPEAQKIRALAEPAGVSAPGWIVALIRTHLMHAVPFNDAELDRLLDTTRELAAIGRNLNMLTHRLLKTDRYAEAWEPQRLEKVIAAVRQEVRVTAGRAQRRFGADDAKT